MNETKEELEGMKKLGFELLGNIFKETFTYIQIENKLKELNKNECN